MGIGIIVSFIVGVAFQNWNNNGNQFIITMIKGGVVNMGKMKKRLVCLDPETEDDLRIIQKRFGLNRSSAVRKAVQNEANVIKREGNTEIIGINQKENE